MKNETDCRKQSNSGSSRAGGFGILSTAVEKNLASLGFFTPSNKRIRTQKSKTVTFTKTIDGNRVQAKAIIVPGALYGLPTTADQDKYFALQKIVTNYKKRHGEVRNPIDFTSAELLDLLRQNRRSGKNYELVNEWLNVMATTTIISEGVVYLAGRKVWARDRFRVFERVVTFGSEMSIGNRAAKNYVWLSDWQLENINNNHLLPVDLEDYLRLKNHIAKALVPHLQIWLFASRDAGLFEKCYEDLCQVLNLRQYFQPSKIKEKLGPSLNELVENGYISNWSLDLTSDRTRHKILFRHGERFCCERTGGKTGRQQPGGEKASSEKKQQLKPFPLVELVKRGIPENRARKLLLNTAERQEVLDQLEWGDYWIRQNSGSRIVNPTGFYIYLIKENIQPPETFETSRKKALFEEAQKARERQIEEQTALEMAYEEYRTKALGSFISENYSEKEYQVLIERKKRELLPRYRQIEKWKPEILKRFLDTALRADLSSELPLPTFEEYVGAQQQATKRE